MEQLWFIANLAEVLEAATTSRSCACTARPATNRPCTSTRPSDEGFYVLSGSMTLWVGDADPGQARAGRVRAGARTASRTPTARATRAPSRSSPPPRAASSRSCARPARRRCAPELPVLDGPPDVERLARIAAAHGITLLGPPGMLPRELLATA